MQKNFDFIRNRKTESYSVHRNLQKRFESFIKITEMWLQDRTEQMSAKDDKIRFKDKFDIKSEEERRRSETVKKYCAKRKLHFPKGWESVSEPTRHTWAKRCLVSRRYTFGTL